MGYSDTDEYWTNRTMKLLILLCILVTGDKTENILAPL